MVIKFLVLYYNIIIISYIINKQHYKIKPKSMNFVERLEKIFIFQNTVFGFGDLLGIEVGNKLPNNYAS